MELTGKALTAFKAYVKKDIGWTNEDFTTHYKAQGYDKYTLTDIIAWLDSVGIYVSIEYIYGEHFSCCVETLEQTAFTKGDTRQQATEQAIERAVELFNSM